MQKIIKLFIIILVLVAIGLFILYKINNSPEAKPSTDSNLIVLYYRIDCPHCKNVEKFLEENKVSEKISFVQKEVGNNSQNNNSLLEKAKLCQLNTKEVGVPFLWDGEKCYLGDTDIIAFFQKKIDALTSSNPSGACQELEKETLAKLTPLLDTTNYCNSDSDCLNATSLFACPFNCNLILANRNADLTIAKDLTNKYYDVCPTCENNCPDSSLIQAEIICREKKCSLKQ